MGGAQRQVLESTERRGEVIARYGATAKNGTDALLWRTLSAVFQASISIDRKFLDIRTREL